MCKCNPNIRSPWCLKCMPISGFRPMDFDGDELVSHPFDKVKEIIKTMNHLSEDEFKNKYINDVLFHNSVDALTLLASQKGDLR